jgi:hypothetical protein
MANCGRCHTCGAKIKPALDGEEWCPVCQKYQRPRAHGWASDDKSPCSCVILTIREKTETDCSPESYLDQVVTIIEEHGNDSRVVIQGPEGGLDQITTAREAADWVERHYKSEQLRWVKITWFPMWSMPGDARRSYERQV